MNGIAADDAAGRPADIVAVLTAAYAALLPYQFGTGQEMNIAPADLVLVLILLLAAGRLKYCRRVWSAWHMGIALAFLFGSLVAAARSGALDRYELLNKDFGLLLPFLIYTVITSTVSDWSDLRRILRVFTLSVVLINIVAVGGFLALYHFGVSTPFTRYGLRLSGMVPDPNAYGGLLVVALAICEGASWGPKPLLSRRTLWISRLSLTLGIVFSFSRSAWMALGAALIVLAMIRIEAVARLVLTWAVIAPFVVLLMGGRFVPIFEEMASRPEQVQGRIVLIEDALHAFTHHPFIGGGIGSFRQAEGEIEHNTALWFLADFGIVGLVALFGFLAWFFAKGWSAFRLAPTEERPLVLALLAAHAAMLGLAMGIEAFYQRQWWLVFGMIASSYCLALKGAEHSFREG